MNSLLENLNENQKKAVLHNHGPLLILAGAGAGKTKAISHRVAHLVSVHNIRPDQILAITFTNKAAKEMKQRINSLLDQVEKIKPNLETESLNILTEPMEGEIFDFEDSDDLALGGLSKKSRPFVSTFHALGVYILRQNAQKLGIPKSFSILDKDDSLSIVKTIMKDLEMDTKQFPPPKMQSIISRYKGDMVTVQKFTEEEGDNYFGKQLISIWEKYEEELKKQGALDFADLLTKTVFLLEYNTDVLEYYQNKWKYLLIDEYQDTNKCQYKLSKMLAEKHNNICVIGDVDQCIYSWRGADYKNIMKFEKDYPDFMSITFKENYRSTKTIVEAASRVIEKNKIRKEKIVESQREDGAQISIYEADTARDEAEFVAKKINELKRQNADLSEIAILYRANFQSRIIEETFLRKGIAYQLLGTQFYHRKEVKDIFAFLRSAINRDSQVDIKRIINVPARGIGKTTVDNYFSGKKITDKTQEKLDEFFKLLDSIKEKIETVLPSEVVRFVILETGYQSSLQTSGKDEDKEKFENLQELVTIASRYDSFPVTPPKEKTNDDDIPVTGIEQMLIDASLMGDQDTMTDKNKEEVGKPRLMTVHAAKGLEFENVFIVGLEEGLFPHSAFGDASREKDEEERRLFYVALTRAKDKLFLSFADSRVVYGGKQMNMPSRFLSDIPDHLVQSENYPISDNNDDLPEIDIDGNGTFSHPSSTTNYLDDFLDF